MSNINNDIIMKKRMFYSLVALIIAAANAMADNFAIAPITVPQGGTAELPIGFLFDSGKTYVGFQLNIAFPEGISSEKDEDGLPAYVKDETSCGKMTIYPTAEDGYAALPQTTSASIKGTSGTLITIILEAAA